jgi:arylsulfatase A-like enzyme
MGSVIRSGEYKLIKYHGSGELELYDLDSDLGETTNLIDTIPAVGRDLNAKLDRWLQETKAAMPRPLKEIAEKELYGRRGR